MSMAQKAIEEQNADPAKSHAWQTKIVGRADVDPRTLVKNPLNHRLHPEAQRKVVKASINELGFIKSVLVNRTTGRIIDGHERTETALNEIERLESLGEDSSHVLVPVEYVELDEQTEAKALAILDASSEMAEVDPEILEQLLDAAMIDDDVLNELTAQMQEDAGLLESLTDDVDPELVDDEDATRVSKLTLKFGEWIVPISKFDIENLGSLAEQYAAENGSYQGFVRLLWETLASQGAE
jgi:hypothetical protein